ncbi:MAG: class I SAM-dependent methyltransferase [Chloroflexi bacterium]|nr:class I SAM-dependent methyltransferase [Chloroflexota bacterium]
MEQYDQLKASFYDQYYTGVAGDVPFYTEESLRARGVVLELGCGTGRVTIPMAEAGVRVIGVDISAPMLQVARTKLADLPSPARQRIRLVQADMRDVDLARRFKLVIIPYRTFMHLLTPQDQVQALLNIHEHLTDTGRLMFNIFDPSAELLDANAQAGSQSLRFDTVFTLPQSGHRVVAWYSRRYDLVRQLIHQEMVFEEIGSSGEVLARHLSPLTLRYSHRYEMHYLLELCGYRVEELYGDFERNPFQGAEQIWVVRKQPA